MFFKFYGIVSCFVYLICLNIIVSQEAQALTIASWNIYHLTESEENQRSKRDYRKLRRIAKQLNADIIALQEVGSEKLIQKVFGPDKYEIEIADRNNYFIFGTPERQKTAILIRKGISYKRQDDYEKLDVGGTRYGTVITTEIKGIKTTIMSVHLKSGCWANKYDLLSALVKGKACEKLHKQISYLQGWIKRRFEKEQSFIILGDFNRRLGSKDDMMWHKLSNSGKYKITNVAGNNKSQCWSNSEREFIDHIIVSPAISRRLNRDGFKELVFEEAEGGRHPSKWKKKLSDHCPILAVF